MPLSNFQKQRQAEAFRDGNPVYFVFFSTAPNQADTAGVELSAAGYARITVTNNATNFDVSSTGLYKNKNIIRSGNAGENWPPIVAVGQRNALSGGNLLAYHVLTTPITVYSGNPAEIPADAYQIQF